MNRCAKYDSHCSGVNPPVHSKPPQRATFCVKGRWLVSKRISWVSLRTFVPGSSSLPVLVLCLCRIELVDVVLCRCPVFCFPGVDLGCKNITCVSTKRLKILSNVLLRTFWKGRLFGNDQLTQLRVNTPPALIKDLECESQLKVKWWAFFSS